MKKRLMIVVVGMVLGIGSQQVFAGIIQQIVGTPSFGSFGIGVQFGEISGEYTPENGIKGINLETHISPDWKIKYSRDSYKYESVYGYAIKTRERFENTTNRLVVFQQVMPSPTSPDASPDRKIYIGVGIRKENVNYSFGKGLSIYEANGERWGIDFSAEGVCFSGRHFAIISEVGYIYTLKENLQNIYLPSKQRLFATTGLRLYF